MPSEPLTQEIRLDFTLAEEKILRSRPDELSTKILDSDINLAAIIETISQLATIFSQSDTTQVYAGELSPKSIVIEEETTALFVPLL